MRSSEDEADFLHSAQQCQRLHGDVPAVTRSAGVAAEDAAILNMSGALASAVSRSGSPVDPLSEIAQPVAITCLQWDGDGALNDDDRAWMVQTLAAADPLGMLLPGTRTIR